MSAQDIWARKYHELWEKLEKNTKHSLHCAVEVAGDADMFATDAQPAALTLSAADLACRPQSVFMTCMQNFGQAAGLV